MPTEIPDLWDDDIKVDVLPPLVILRAQDEGIRRKTQGILRAAISTTVENEPDGSVWVSHEFGLVAPALGSQESLLTVGHAERKLYPVQIFVPDEITWNDGKTISRSIRCYDPDEFIAQLRAALRSPPTKGSVSTLLALSNESRLTNAAKS
ncbi:MAG: hypothetical protein K2V38_19745 [Gemmataceae bacterium]|nr:hypothetical protein [Gemmataceae bacterium]